MAKQAGEGENQVSDELAAMLGIGPKGDDDTGDEDEGQDEEGDEEDEEGGEGDDSDEEGDDEDDEAEGDDSEGEEGDEEDEDEEDGDEGDEGDEDEVAGLLEGDDDEGEEDEGDEGEEDEDETTRLRNELANTKARVAELEAGEDEEEEEEVSVELEEVSFVADQETYEQALESREEFNKLLNEVAKQASLAAVKGVLKRVPQMITRQVGEEVSNQTLVNDFFRVNSDLTGARKFVAFVFTEVQSKNPDKGYKELLDMTATEVRQRMGVSASGKKKAKTGGKRPGTRARAGKRASRRGAPQKPSGIGEEIERMSRSR